MVFGDSNAYRPGNTRWCWPALLHRLSGGNLEVINESHNGRTTRFDSGPCNGDWAIQHILQRCERPDAVLIALGTNDVKRIYGPPAAADIVSGLKAIIAAIKKAHPGCLPVILTPPPLGVNASGDLTGACLRIPPLAAEYRRMARRRHLPVIDLFSKIDPRRDLTADGVHLNQRGRRAVAQQVWRHVRRARFRKAPGIVTRV
jgi:lysophospholipase L1-like esterase